MASTNLASAGERSLGKVLDAPPRDALVPRAGRGRARPGSLLVRATTYENHWRPGAHLGVMGQTGKMWAGTIFFLHSRNNTL
jgi:hypothetical protein